MIAAAVPRLLSVALLAVGFAGAPGRAAAADEVDRAASADSQAGLLTDVVLIGVPGLRWYDVQASAELTALVDQSDVGSISVKTSTAQTCPIDGWLTISAGTRARGSTPGQPCPELPAVTDGRVSGWSGYVDLQAEHHTDAEPGRLGALGNKLCGFGPGAAVAVARPDGTVNRPGETASWWPTFEPRLLAGCNDAVVDAGRLPPREGRAAARSRIADLVAQARAQDRWVLLVGVSEEAAGAHREVLAAIQLPPDDRPRWLTSSSTRRTGLIQLTDLTATLLSDSAPEVLDGAEVGFGGQPHRDAAAVVRDRLDTNERFEQPPTVLVAVSLTLLAAQLLALAWHRVRRSMAARRVFAGTLLTQGGFFAAVFLSTVTGWWRWPQPGLALYLVSIAISAGLAAGAAMVLRGRAVLGIAVVVYVVLLVDGVLGTPLQVGSMFADGPVIGGRFFGFGNSTFAALAVATLVTAAAVAHRLLPRSRTRAALAVLAVGGAAIVVDGAPGWGTDFGGVVALTPAVLLLAWHCWRGGVSWRALLALALSGLVVVAVLAFADYRRPAADRTHLGAFVARLREGDVGDLFARKLEMSSGYLVAPSGWAMLAAVLAATAACLLPDRVPSVAYRRFVGSSPMTRPALLALALCGLVGMVVNDAGVTVPAIMIGFALPLLVAQLVVGPPPEPGRAGPDADRMSHGSSIAETGARPK